jgi:hypothetical protein
VLSSVNIEIVLVPLVEQVLELRAAPLRHHTGVDQWCSAILRFLFLSAATVFRRWKGTKVSICWINFLFIFSLFAADERTFSIYFLYSICLIPFPLPE